MARDGGQCVRHGHWVGGRQGREDEASREITSVLCSLCYISLDLGLVFFVERVILTTMSRKNVPIQTEVGVKNSLVQPSTSLCYILPAFPTESPRSDLAGAQSVCPGDIPFR